MLSLSPNLYNGNKYSSIIRDMRSFSGADVSGIIEAGDKALNENRLQDALNTYNSALSKSPDSVEINRKIAKTYFRLKDYTAAEQKFKIYLEKQPEDDEAWIELGDNYRYRGLYQEAKKCFQTALNMDNSNDLARRKIMQTENDILCCFSPDTANKAKEEYAQKNLKQALKMTVDYMSPEFMKDLKNVQIRYGKTASMSGTSNIAQYENKIKAITISDEYKYAAPQVIAAYLVHESVHGKDNDPYTSIREEQDAYRMATQFWIKHSGGVKDPEMDYAASLYNQSPETLDRRVEEIYMLRDPEIAKTSPNHPPEKAFHFNRTKSKAASQSIKEYDYIA